MAVAIFLLVLSLGAGVAGFGYLRTARRMPSYATTRGRIVKRELGLMADTQEGVFGKGGGYYLKPTFEYEVGGRTYTSDRYEYAHRGWKAELAEEKLAALGEEVDVHYDPADPQQAYLVKHSPGLGYALITGAALGLLIALLSF